MIPVGPSYRFSSSPNRLAESASYPAPVTGTGRVCGVSARSDPRITTLSILSSVNTAISWSQKARQRKLGSMPRSSTTSRSALGGRHTDSVVDGHSTARVTPSICLIVGRLTWKS
ncbi:hypothetical protein MTP03_24290 [Tsukamurella sp. PLM1]|nr:hypothetical protein MTP03_24290 [Tsukamurella sp. PLM1]